MTRTLLAVPFALALLACTDPLETDSVEGFGKVKGGDGEQCGALGCGTNSAHLGPTEFHELDETGTRANLEGFKIESFKKNGTTYKLDVSGTTLSGWQYNIWTQTWVKTLFGAALVGSEITVKNVNNGDTFLIVVDRVLAQPLWQAPSETIEAYELLWYGNGLERQHVCDSGDPGKDGDPYPTSAFTAILFTGDRYNRETLTVTATTPRAAGSWFNIACGGNVLFKLAANRFTAATQSSSNITTWAHRQAMMKLYTSDVCNTGQAFTVKGTALRWNFQNAWHSPTNYSTPEAVWNETGALCLGTHRLHSDHVNSMDLQIKEACGEIPSCASYTLPVAGAYFSTFSPASP